MDKLELPKEFPPGLAFKLGLSFVAHPLEVSKVLIQLGHEPIAPRRTKTFLGKPALALPSVFQYCRHVRRKEGWTGLWRGVTPRLSSIALQSFTAAKFDEYVPPEDELSEVEAAVLSEEEKVRRFVRITLREMASKAVCVVVSQPLQVITIRAIAEFVGGENKYTGDITGGVFSGIVSTINDNGILGLWSGVVPRLIGEVSLVAVSASITFLINTYVLQDKEFNKFTSNFSNFVAQSLTYPFQVIGNCMTVSRSGLAAGYPPFMPLYLSWTDCYSHLRGQNQLKRGSSLFFRYYSGPQVIVGDRIIPVSNNMLKPPAALSA